MNDAERLGIVEHEVAYQVFRSARAATREFGPPSVCSSSPRLPDTLTTPIADPFSAKIGEPAVRPPQVCTALILFVHTND
jgi:hypothetical protein